MPLSLSTLILQRYNITDYTFIKQGGQKTVFLVNIEGVKYALKLIHNSDERFNREVDICKKYSEKGGIPKILQIDIIGSQTIILEEYIIGNDLFDIKDNYFGNEVVILKLLHDICKILLPIWYDQYVHRDLKPQNIRIKNDGLPIVLDFGIARALNEESLAMTGDQPLSYMFASPEQYAGRKNLISYRTDFFCLGIIAYFLYTGKYPFGDRKDIVDSTFKTGNLAVNVDSMRIEEFCNAVFTMNPSDRPRRPEDLINLTIL
jgi:serine/threonine-protein kinase